MKIAVMGAGSWGTTIAKVFADAGNDVLIWARRPDVVEEINHHHHNDGYLPDIVLPTNLSATGSAEEALAGAEIVVMGIPSQSLRNNIQLWKEFLAPDSVIVSLAKGIEHHTGLRMSQVITQVAEISGDRVVVLSGPNLAREIAQEQPAATIVACTDKKKAEKVQKAVATGYFRPYTHTDVIGCEIGGACKNVIALACGMAVGNGFGENTVATVISRGLAEIIRLGTAVGAEARTFSGLAGLGDLVATCSSPLSRNRRFGERLGAGESIEQARAVTHGQVAEGVVSSLSILELSKQYKVEMPITQAVVNIAHRGADVHESIWALMGRTRKAE